MVLEAQYRARWLIWKPFWFGGSISLFNESCFYAVQLQCKLFCWERLLLVDVDKTLNPGACFVGDLVIAKFDKHLSIWKNFVYMRALLRTHFQIY